MELGAQMFTVHDYTKDLKSFEESLKRIAEIGYTCVQVSGTCDYNPKWLKDKLEKYGLKCVITHTAPDKLINATEYVIEDHNVFDCKYIGLGGMPAIWNPDYTIDQALDSFKKDFLEPAKKIKDGGKYFMYHNHDYEFVKLQDGRTLYDAIIEDIPDDTLGFTVDTYWVQCGGVDPVSLIRKLKGRCPVIHLKDFMPLRHDPDKNRQRMAACGDGNLDFKAILDASKEAGVEYALVEQDNCFGEDPFQCLERSYKYLKSIGY